MPITRQTNPHAARFRRDSTEAERCLWRSISNRQLSGYKFRRQASIGPYIADFLCISARLIVEVDGGQHTEETDAARTAWLEDQGYRVVRFWNNEVMGNIEGVLTVLLAELQRRSATLT
ncbi:DUF559 domain-containing protein [Sphingomonas lacunae]|uniref:DUF559 domain-containing protein n=1 Tax=Sphingomonas lacunae TaxID=2698828 RepID=A0A6M4ATA4_9SPHN|nr:endonuclease domain-containing protein [Sphingomonas lacunae]QJQ32313.1 DUF559 domain-containing protein [Sphingomonas lacunae]